MSTSELLLGVGTWEREKKGGGEGVCNWNLLGFKILVYIRRKIGAVLVRAMCMVGCVVPCTCLL